MGTTLTSVSFPNIIPVILGRRPTVSGDPFMKKIALVSQNMMLYLADRLLGYLKL